MGNTGEVDAAGQTRELVDISLLRETRRQVPVIVRRYHTNRPTRCRQGRNCRVDGNRPRRFRNDPVHDRANIRTTATDLVELRLWSAAVGPSGARTHKSATSSATRRTAEETTADRRKLPPQRTARDSLPCAHAQGARATPRAQGSSSTRYPVISNCRIGASRCVREFARRSRSSAGGGVGVTER